MRHLNLQSLNTEKCQNAFKDRYKLLPGDFSESDNVWLAESNGSLFVVKKVPRRSAGEVATLQILDHPNICRLIEVVGSDEYLYLVMEHCAGGDLFHYISESNGLDEVSCRKIIRQIASALNFLHNLDISHGDVKLEKLVDCCWSFNSILVAAWLTRIRYRLN